MKTAKLLWTRARERNDEGHREVTSLLQTPGDWLLGEETKESAVSTSVPGTDDSAGSASNPEDASDPKTSSDVPIVDLFYFIHS